MESNYDLIKKAIENKLQIFATYNYKRRELCPHVLGTKDNKYKVLAYQFGGEVSKGKLDKGGEWRCFFLSKLSNIELKEGEWHTGKRSGEKRQTCVDRVHVEVNHS